MIILHASDLHFGRPHRPLALRALARFAVETSPDVVVFSGDFTQRAKVNEYEAARTFLATLEVPVVVVAGNHDVPLYRFWERLVSPYGNYRKYIARELDTVLDLNVGPGLPEGRFVGLNSAAPRSAIVNGRLTRKQLAFAERSFASASPESLRILVVHHNLLDPADGEPGRPMRGARRVLERIGAWGVDLVISGHIHRSYLGWNGVPFIHAGTASSNRGRGLEHARNSVNLIRVEGSNVEVSVYLYSEVSERFLQAGSHQYQEGIRARIRQ